MVPIVPRLGDSPADRMHSDSHGEFLVDIHPAQRQAEALDRTEALLKSEALRTPLEQKSPNFRTHCVVF